MSKAIYTHAIFYAMMGVMIGILGPYGLIIVFDSFLGIAIHIKWVAMLIAFVYFTTLFLISRKLYKKIRHNRLSYLALNIFIYLVSLFVTFFLNFRL